jgi:hypothetical protein
MVRFWRKGDRVRAYIDDGGYPGDGRFCFRGRVDGTLLRGWELGPPPEPYQRSYRVKRVGERLVFKGMYSFDSDWDAKRWRSSSVREYRTRVPEATSGSWCRTSQF